MRFSPKVPAAFLFLMCKWFHKTTDSFTLKSAKILSKNFIQECHFSLDILSCINMTQNQPHEEQLKEIMPIKT